MHDGARCGLAAVWGDTAVRFPAAQTASRLANALTATAVHFDGQGGALRVADLLADFPVALLLTER